MKAATLATFAGLALLVLAVGFRAGAWLMEGAVTAWFQWQAKQADDGHDVWPTDMEASV